MFDVVQFVLGLRDRMLLSYTGRNGELTSDSPVLLRHRAGVETRAQEAANRFPVMAEAYWPQSRRPIGRVESPVLLQLPRQETEDPGNARENDGECRLGDAGRIRKRNQGREQYLVRHRHYREVFHRVHLRLEEQVECEPDDVGDWIP